MDPSELDSPNVDRYVIDEYLAEGGMGAIFLGKKLGLEGFEKQVVLKQLLPEFTSQREFIDLFLREAKLSASLDHANIVHTLDLVAAGEDYFIVMEYVRGGDLRTLLRRIKQRGRRLCPAGALFIAREVLSALAYAHEKHGPDGQHLGLIHRDISPSNIMLSVAGEVKLTDFGIAKAATHKSVFYRVKGKVGYMSPEQAYGDKPLDQRSDLYSLAVALYEMLAGERLFVADMLSTPEQIYRQPVRPLEDQPGMPPGTDALLNVALGNDPDHRFQTALEFQDALVKLAFDSALLFSSRDLADHLRELCGEDPSSWGLEVKETTGGPGTELLDEQEAAHNPLDEGQSQFSGVAFTSVFSAEMAEQLGVQAAPETLDPGDDDPTRHIDLSSADQPAPEPTRNIGRPVAPHAAAPAPTPPPQAPRPRQRPGSASGASPPALTAQVSPMPPIRPEGAEQRRPLSHYLVLLGLLVAALGVALMAGLSGPDLSSSAPPAQVNTPLPVATPAVEPVAAPDPDVESEALDDPADPPLLPAGFPDQGAPTPPDQGEAQLTLSVKSTPAGAEVTLDSVFQCRTPCAVKNLDPSRVMLLSVRLEGHRPWSAMVDMADRAEVQLSPYLSRSADQAAVGHLEVTTPTPSDLYIDGKQVGHVSSQGSMALPPGEYEVALSHPRKTRRPRHLVRIEVGKTTSLSDNF